MYDGEQLPREDVAIIHGRTPIPFLAHLQRLESDRFVHVLTVDGNDLDAKAAEVLPGRHSVEAMVTWGVWPQRSVFICPEPIAFNAEGGRVYQVLASVGREPGTEKDAVVVYFWIEDEEFGTVVAGNFVGRD